MVVQCSLPWLPLGLVWFGLVKSFNIQHSSHQFFLLAFLSFTSLLKVRKLSRAKKKVMMWSGLRKKERKNGIGIGFGLGVPCLARLDWIGLDWIGGGINKVWVGISLCVED